MPTIPTRIKYYIVVEGKTEEQYFTRLNQLDEIKTSPIRFAPVQAGTSNARSVVRKYNEILRTHKVRKPTPGWNDVKMIVLDQDVFCWGKEKASNFPKGVLYFSLFNFEDFLVQHLNSSDVIKWNNICTQQKHFNNPMKEKCYLAHLKKVIPSYKKGILPFDLEINHLQQLKDNVNKKCFNPPIHQNDFCKWFIALLTKYKLLA